MSRMDHRMGWPGIAALIADAMPQPPRPAPLGMPRIQDQGARAALDIDPARADPEPELPDGVWEGKPGVFWACCSSCERDYELCYDVQDFTDEGNFCGGSDRCLP